MEIDPQVRKISEAPAIPKSAFSIYCETFENKVYEVEGSAPCLLNQPSESRK
jgi:hypothetical protein